MASSYNPPQVNGIWLWVYYNKIAVYPIFYLLKGDYIIEMWGYVGDLPRKKPHLWGFFSLGQVVVDPAGNTE